MSKVWEYERHLRDMSIEALVLASVGWHLGQNVSPIYLCETLTLLEEARQILCDNFDTTTENGIILHHLDLQYPARSQLREIVGASNHVDPRGSWLKFTNKISRERRMNSAATPHILIYTAHNQEEVSDPDGILAIGQWLFSFLAAAIFLEGISLRLPFTRNVTSIIPGGSKIYGDTTLVRS